MQKVADYVKAVREKNYQNLTDENLFWTAVITFLMNKVRDEVKVQKLKKRLSGIYRCQKLLNKFSSFMSSILKFDIPRIF